MLPTLLDGNDGYDQRTVVKQTRRYEVRTVDLLGYFKIKRFKFLLRKIRSINKELRDYSGIPALGLFHWVSANSRRDGLTTRGMI